MDTFEIPPWKGTALVADAYSGPDGAGFRSLEGTVGDGTLNGALSTTSPDNELEATFRFAGVPAEYLVEHLNYPEVLTGALTGEITYSMDQDDPNTLKGQGAFDVSPRLGEHQPLPQHTRFSGFTSGLQTFQQAAQAPDIVRVDASARQISRQPQIFSVGLFSQIEAALF